MNLLLMSASVVGAAIAAIAKSFPKEPISKVQMLSTIPQLGQVIATLIFTWLTYIMTRKNISLVAILFVIVGGLIPAFYNSNLNIILACMIAIGFGTGLISNVGPVLLQEHFEGEARATVMGWSVGVNSVGMMAFTAIGSALGSTDWRNLFWIYAVGVVILLVTYFMVPQDTRLKREKNSSGKASIWATLKNVNKLAYIYLLITFFTSIAMTMFMANQSIVLAGKGMGTGCGACAGPERTTQPLRAGPASALPSPAAARRAQPRGRQSRRSQPGGCPARADRSARPTRRRGVRGDAMRGESRGRPRCAGPHAQRASTQPSSTRNARRAPHARNDAWRNAPRDPGGKIHPRGERCGRPSARHGPSPHPRESPQNDPRSG